MNVNFPKYFLIITLSFFALTGTSDAWYPPLSPGVDFAVPVNLSTTSPQIKQGVLQVNGGIVSGGSGRFEGRVFVGTTTEPSIANTKLVVGGSVAATEYCDLVGNCTPPRFSLTGRGTTGAFAYGSSTTQVGSTEMLHQMSNNVIAFNYNNTVQQPGAGNNTKFLVNGTLYTRIYCFINSGACISSLASPTDGVVIPFNRDTCPPGWSEATELYGRTVVGYNSGDTAGNFKPILNTGGSRTRTISKANLPAYGELAGGDFNRFSAEGDQIASEGSGLNIRAIDKENMEFGNQYPTAVSVMDPYVVLLYCRKN